MSANPNTGIRALILQRLAPLQALHCMIEDDSAQHAGHGGWREDGSHFSITLVSAQFTGLMRVKRHRLVYDCLHDLMQERIHALALTTLAPQEWQADPLPSSTQPIDSVDISVNTTPHGESA